MFWRKAASHLNLSQPPYPSSSSPPSGLHWRSHTLFIVSTVAIGLFTDLFLYGLVVPVLPFILRDRIGIPLSATQPHVSGLLAAYAGASVLFSPMAGYIADRTASRQLPFLSGLFALLLATLMLYLAQNEAVLVLARLLQGVSAAIVWTIGLALCLDTVGPRDLGKTIGSIFSFIGVGSLISPVLGGILYKYAGYEGVFGVGAGILLVDFVMRFLVIEKKVAHKYDRSIYDPFANDNIIPQDQDQNQDQEANGDAGGDAGEEANGEEQPLLSKDKDEFRIPSGQSSLVRRWPLAYCLKDGRLLSALLVALVQATLFGTFDATIATESQKLFGFSSLTAGLLFIPLGIFDLFVGPLAGWAVDRYGTKPVAVLGYGWLTPVMFSLRAVNSGGKDQLILYNVLLGMAGIGLAAIGAPSIVEAGTVVEKYHKANPDFFGENGPYAQLYGLNSMVFSGGLALGPFIAGALRDNIGYGNMNAVVSAICLVTAVTCWIWMGGKPRILRRRGY